MESEGLKGCHKNSVKEICKSFDNDPGNLINILHDVQDKLGYLPEEVQREVAACLKISAAKVYGVVSFYSFFTMEPKGRYPISVCMGTACYVRGAEKLLDELKEQLHIGIGEVTGDGKFSLDCLRCVGACGLAPVILVGKKVYAKIEPYQIKGILDSCE